LECFGLVQKQAHWWKAKAMSGQVEEAR
jgi:hypothetical protein